MLTGAVDNMDLDWKWLNFDKKKDWQKLRPFKESFLGQRLASGLPSYAGDVSAGKRILYSYRFGVGNSACLAGSETTFDRYWYQEQGMTVQDMQALIVGKLDEGRGHQSPYNAPW